MSGTTFPSTFTENERLNNQPVKLFTFARGDRLWRYTDQPEDVTVDGVDYRAAVIEHGDIQRNEETAGAELTVTTSQATPMVAELEAIGYDGPPIICTIRKTHRAGVGGVASLSTAVWFKGRVTAPTFRDDACEYRLTSMAGLLERPILRISFAPTCQHTVYDKGCGEDPVPFTVAGCAVTGLAGRTITVVEAALQPDGWYTAGYFVVESGAAAGERAFIQEHVGQSLTVLTRLPLGIALADTVAITAGCDGLESTCAAKFNNREYFLGFSRMPTVNPFDQAV